MNLYIKIVNGVITDHPILEQNLFQVIPGFDPNNLPKDDNGQDMFKPFKRVAVPAPSSPFVNIESTYQLCEDGVVRDVHTEIPFTEEARAAKIAQAYNIEHPKGWVFAEEKCCWEPPTPYPGSENDNTYYIWNEDLEQWVAVEKKGN